MRPERPALGALVWGALGFFLALLLLVIYRGLEPTQELNDAALDARAARSERAR